MVSMILLEEAEVDYRIHSVNLMKGEHKKESYLAINPKAKVPAMKLDGVILTENPVLIQALVHRFPEAKLMPETSSPLESLQQWSHLCFCSSTLHPAVTRVCKPEFFGEADAVDAIRAKGKEAMCDGLSLVEDRLKDNRWWYGDSWSAMDAYIFWVFSRLNRCDFDFADFQNLVYHSEKMKVRVAVQRAVAKEKSILPAS